MNLDYCHATVQRIISLLSERRGAGDVLEFLVTVNFVADVLGEFARTKTPMDLSLVSTYLNEYEELLMQLVTEGRFARFVTSNRVRKKLEVLNSNLHTEVSKIFMRLRTERRNQAVVRQPRDNSVQRFLAQLDPVARKMWEDNFGENPMAQWDQFMRVYRDTVKQPVNESGLRYLLDNAGTNCVSLYKLTEFLKGFGPLLESPRKVHDVVSADWFHGYLSSEEAVRLLHSSQPFTFLVRISKSRLGAFALAYVNEQQAVVHTLIATSPPHGFKIDEEVNSSPQDRVFGSLGEVVKFYCYMLKHPFDSTLAREAWFHGDLTSVEANEILAGKPNGTFLFRFSSYRGFLAVSYVEHGKVQHGKVEVSRLGFRFENESKEYLSLQHLVDDYQKLLVTPIDNTPFPSTDVSRTLSSSNGAATQSSSYRALPPPKPTTERADSAPTNYTRLPGMRPGGMTPGRGSPGRGPGRGFRSPTLAVRRPSGGSPMRAANNAVQSSDYGSIPTMGTAVGAQLPQQNGGYGSIPVPSGMPATPPAGNDGTGYGAIPQQPSDLSSSSEYGSVPTTFTPPPGVEGEYGSIPVCINGAPQPKTSAYGNVPVGQNKAASGAGYGAVPVDPNLLKNGAAHQQQGGSNYGSVPQGSSQLSPAAAGYGSIPLH